MMGYWRIELNLPPAPPRSHAQGKILWVAAPDLEAAIAKAKLIHGESDPEFISVRYDAAILEPPIPSTPPNP